MLKTTRVYFGVLHLPLYLVQIPGFSFFRVLNLNYENFKLYLQNTLNMLKTARVYFEVLQFIFEAGHKIACKMRHVNPVIGR